MSNDPNQRPARPTTPQPAPGEASEGGQAAQPVPDEYLRQLFEDEGGEEGGGAAEAPAEVSLQKQRVWG